MVSQHRRRNERLRALITEAQWTNHSFSLAVNHVAAESGEALQYDRTAVSHWLAGTHPRTSTPLYIAEALSRRLGREVSVADIGLADGTPPRMPLFDDLPAGAALIRLVSADLDPVHRMVLRRLPFRVDWAVAPAWKRPETSSAPMREPLDAAPAVVEVMTSAFAAAGEAFGGGHTHAILAAYLNTGLWARLRSADEDDDRPALLGAAAMVTCLTAFTCFDNLHHNLAQQYYRIASRLATEAGDTTAHVLVLRGMSAQASFLGYHRHALRLAQAAVKRSGRTVPRVVHASLLGQAAMAHGTLGHREEALTLLANARRLVDDEAGSRWDTDTGRADVDYYTGRALTCLSEHGKAEEALRDSLRWRPVAQRRSRMVTTYHLADVQLRRGSLDAACATWKHFVLDYPGIHSARVKLLLSKFRDSLRLHAEHHCVRHVLHISEHLA